MPGTFIVIDGADGSGKKTQIDLLEQKLIEEGYPVKTADFPRYGEYSAIFVEKYLNGYYGGPDDVTSKQASFFYALDRYAASREMKEWLAQGHIIISNRYVSSSMGHQGGKIPDEEERKAYIDWLFELEYDILQIPKPDLTLFLHVPHQIGMELVKQKTQQRDYIEGDGEAKVDIHEADKEHMKNAEASYLYAAKHYPGWHTIACAPEGNLQSIDNIHHQIWTAIQPLLQKH